MLTGTENTLFRYLWRHGAQVFLHVDPALAENGQGHWACTEPVSYTHLATREFLPLIKEIGGYVVLRREQNACPDISRDGIAAPGGLEPETASGVKA